MSDLRKAVKFFTHLAAGIPMSNLKWGKSQQEINDFYHLAAQVLEEKATSQLVYLPFKTDGILSVSGGLATLKGKNLDGEEIEVTGKICIFECTQEEAKKHDKAANKNLEKVCVEDEI